MLNPRRVLPHSLIYDRVWGYDFGPTSNALRVYVGYLRRKLEDAGAQAADPHRPGGRIRAAGAARMSLRARMGLAAGVAVALAVIAVAFSAYAGTRIAAAGSARPVAAEPGRPLLAARRAARGGPGPGAIGGGGAGQAAGPARPGAAVRRGRPGRPRRGARPRRPQRPRVRRRVWHRDARLPRRRQLVTARPG